MKKEELREIIYNELNNIPENESKQEIINNLTDKIYEREQNIKIVQIDKNIIENKYIIVRVKSTINYNYSPDSIKYYYDPKRKEWVLNNNEDTTEHIYIYNIQTKELRELFT